MKILQVLAGAEFGGAEMAFVDMCIALHEAGESVEVVTRPNQHRVDRLIENGLKVHKLRFGGVFDVYTPYKMRQIIDEFKPHIVQTWMSRASDKTPAWDDGKDTPQYINVARLGGYYKTKYFKNTNYFATITPDIKRHLVDHGIAADRVRHINNFAETELAPIAVDRASLDTPEDAPVLLSLSRLHKAKAIDTLLEALVCVPKAYLWIAGEGPDREELEAFANELNVQDRVRFLGWREDRAALLQASDVCVFPSRYEPFGTVFVQAWAQKTPLVVTEADGPKQFVRHEEDGLMVAIDDVDALSGALNRVIDDKVLADRLVQNGWNRYQNEFTKEKTVQAYLEYYHDVLEREGLTSRL